MNIDKNKKYMITISSASYSTWKMKTKRKFMIGKVEGRQFTKSIGTFRNQKGDFYICDDMDIGKSIKLIYRFIL